MSFGCGGGGVELTSQKRGEEVAFSVKRGKTNWKVPLWTKCNGKKNSESSHGVEVHYIMREREKNAS